MSETRKKMIAAGHRLPESVAHAIQAEAVRQTGTDTERARFVRWAEKGWRWEDARAFTATARRGFECGRKLRSEHEFVHRHGPGSLDRLLDFASDVMRAEGAYRGGIN